MKDILTSLCLLLVISTTIMCTIFVTRFFKGPNSKQQSTSVISVTQERTARTLDISFVTCVAAQNSGKLIIKQCSTDNETLEISAPVSVMQYIQANKNSNTLDLRIQDNTKFSSDPKIVYTAIVKHLNRISASGVIEVDMGKIETPEIEINGSGATSIRGKVAAERLQIKLSGASSGNVDYTGKELDVRIKGAVSLAGAMNADLATINLSGAAMLEGLKAASVNATLTGASRASLDATESLKCSLSGASSLSYGGSPTVQHSISGVSKIRPK